MTTEQISGRAMTGKTVLVTGGTSGIGKATALGLAALGAHLAITGRDRDRTEDAAREIRAAGGGPVDVFVADLSSQAEVRRLADEVLQRFARIDVLVNNVGGFWNTRHVTADGLEHTFALNHLAPFLLTNLLLDRLSESAPARVVMVASHAQSMGRIDLAEWIIRRPPSPPARTASPSRATGYDQQPSAFVPSAVGTRVGERPVTLIDTPALTVAPPGWRAPGLRSSDPNVTSRPSPKGPTS